ncbi:Hypothetical predicted protein, partial [Pelobates cultripes]
RLHAIHVRVATLACSGRFNLRTFRYTFGEFPSFVFAACSRAPAFTYHSRSTYLMRTVICVRWIFPIGFVSSPRRLFMNYGIRGFTLFMGFFWGFLRQIRRLFNGHLGFPIARVPAPILSHEGV